MGDYGFFKGEGGKVWKMDLPLPEDIAKQLKAGTLVEVDEPKADEPKKTRRSTAKKAPEPGKVEPLTDEEKLLAVEAELLADVDAEHDAAEVRAKLAELAAK